MTTTTTMTTPEVWVGCLGCYNAGNLIGKWVDGTEAGAQTWQSIGCPPPDIYDSHEELWVFDHQGYDGLLTGECSPMEAQRTAEVIDDLNGRPVKAFAAYCEYTGADRDADAIRGFDDAWLGEWESEAEYAENLWEETENGGKDVEWPVTCIDWERAATDLFTGAYWSSDTDDGNVYVFIAS